MPPMPQNSRPPLLQILSERILTGYLRLAMRSYLTLSPLKEPTIPFPAPGKEYVLYLHIPFCESLCPYCSFNRFVLEKKTAERYFTALRQELRLVADLGYNFSSLYIGGGTPTILPQELIRTIDLANELFHIREVSCETNPNHLTAEIIQQLEGRVQRLSVGVQSFNELLLKKMERFEKYGSGPEILRKVEAAAPHFPSLNIDMIFNFPEQTLEMLQDDLTKVINSGAQQVTFYPLMQAPAKSAFIPSDKTFWLEGRENQYYQTICERLSEHFTPKTAWTFARNGSSLIDEYIVGNDEYLGVGSGVFSYLKDTLYVSTFSLRQYQEAVTNGKTGVIAARKYPRFSHLRYQMMMDLFSSSLNKEKFHLLTGASLEKGLWLELLFLRLAGAFRSWRSYDLSPFGQYLSLVIMREFFTGVNYLRTAARKTVELAEGTIQLK